MTFWRGEYERVERLSTGRLWFEATKDAVRSLSQGGVGLDLTAILLLSIPDSALSPTMWYRMGDKQGCWISERWI